jgi:nitrogen regulatory protein PII
MTMTGLPINLCGSLLTGLFIVVAMVFSIARSGQCAGAKNLLYVVEKEGYRNDTAPVAPRNQAFQRMVDEVEKYVDVVTGDVNVSHILAHIIPGYRQRLQGDGKVFQVRLCAAPNSCRFKVVCPF